MHVPNRADVHKGLVGGGSESASSVPMHPVVSKVEVVEVKLHFGACSGAGGAGGRGTGGCVGVTNSFEGAAPWPLSKVLTHSILPLPGPPQKDKHEKAIESVTIA